MTTVAPNYSREIGGVFAVLSRINGLAVAFPSSIGTGYLSSGTLAFGSGDIRRLVSLMLWGILIAFTLTFIWTPVVVRNPRTVASLFLDDNNELQLAEQLLPIPFYTISLSGIGLVIVMTQLVAGKPIFALLPSLFQLLIQSFGCKFLAKKYSDHLINVMYIYNISDISVFVLNMLLFIYPVVVIRRKLKANNESSILTSLNTTDQPYETFQ
ncbi:hypothetical protein TRFO_17946 [Tritrichomonas foetus]|uniref:Uncharacterized protein n=1 Tax=Tritrichomonas foetus TaxID=1144522 RepID=A0A1J4KR42_9EUKA|nr:hypothetical protein TRFO_17946 [Tritrichomonas foetus]|eukprot:OHT12268.1 hypothetical protein TRFO_17946 [Tritrichomonas foetus]